ncbi:MAG: putative toxin-antitoxin system toxin component, PIN family [Bacteroidetes bacterium]|nr:MAG: putative toxin-antitoxin system toxin component, PIN family [Bacteroidota bacterium]
MKTRVILDTNWYISGTINKNSRKLLYQLITNKELEIYYSRELLYEYKDVITRQKFKKHITWNQARRFIKLVIPLLSEINITTKTELSRDKKDNFLLSMAIDAKADYLVSGDPDLLVIKSIGKTKIINMREFKSLISRNH